MKDKEFNQNVEGVEKIIEELRDGNLSLEEGKKLNEEGEELLEENKKLLDEGQGKVIVVRGEQIAEEPIEL